MTQHHPNHDMASTSEVAMTELLELDAQVLQSYLRELIGWIAETTDREPRQILDLGSGPGTGALALADQFPGASVTAVDVSPQMLHRLEQQAAARGLTHRVRTERADLDKQWPLADGDDSYDLVWAASFMHHLRNPDQGFAQAFESLRPRGLLTVTEMDFFPLVLPADASQSDLEARLHTTANTQPEHEWSGHLRRAGFDLVARRPFEIQVDVSQAGPALNRYAQLSLARLRAHASGSLSAADLAALDILLDPSQPDSVMHRTDLVLRTTRTTWLARRP